VIGSWGEFGALSLYRVNWQICLIFSGETLDKRLLSGHLHGRSVASSESAKCVVGGDEKTSGGGTLVHSIQIGSRSSALRILALALAALALVPSAVIATTAGTSIDVTVHSGSDWGTWSMPLPAPSSPFSWSLSSPLDIYSSTNPELLLGTVDSLTLSGDSDPFVLLGFAFTAGPGPTAFSLSTGVPILPITNGLAFASAAITATEGGVLLDGASVTGAFPGTKAYEASYNLGGGVFADLVSPVVVPPGGGSNTLSERFPVPIGSRTVIPGSVFEIRSTFNFTLSAFDQASGTSRFDIIVPEPSSVVLAAGALAAVAVYGFRRRTR
jgi:hypothetical protein